MISYTLQIIIARGVEVSRFKEGVCHPLPGATAPAESSAPVPTSPPRSALKNIGTCIFLSAGRLVNMFMMPFPQFTVLPTAHAQFYGKLMVCLSSFRGLVGKLSGYITTTDAVATHTSRPALQSSVDMLETLI